MYRDKLTGGIMVYCTVHQYTLTEHTSMYMYVIKFKYKKNKDKKNNLAN